MREGNTAQTAAPRLQRQENTEQFGLPGQKLVSRNLCKTVLMNLFTGKEWRHREETVDPAGEGEGGAS